jgi:hypothetical protein
MHREHNADQEKEKPSRTVFLAMFPLKQLLHAKVRVRWCSCVCGGVRACAVVFVRVRRCSCGLIGRELLRLGLLDRESI